MAYGELLVLIVLLFLQERACRRLLTFNLSSRQPFRHLQRDPRPPRPHQGAAASYCPGLRLITEGDYNDSMVRDVAMREGAPKRQGLPSADAPLTKGTQLQTEPATGLSSQEGSSHVDGARPRPVELLLGMAIPGEGGLLLLMDCPSGSSVVPATMRPPVPPQRPKATGKKKLANRHLPPSPAIPLPLGEWSCDDPRSVVSKPPVRPGLPDVGGDTAPSSPLLFEGGSGALQYWTSLSIIVGIWAKPCGLHLMILVRRQRLGLRYAGLTPP